MREDERGYLNCNRYLINKSLEEHGLCGLRDEWAQWLNLKEVHRCINGSMKDSFLGIYVLELILFNTITSDFDEDRRDMVIKFV